ncbi:hypothetical protein T492DRAFT_337902 [Pavlovales sp. CCMP2436]|nr:hypothetical protein T492DRAFT_337902 [Pavlovales sp. CCMP2436]
MIALVSALTAAALGRTGTALSTAALGRSGAALSTVSLIGRSSLTLSYLGRGRQVDGSRQGTRVAMSTTVADEPMSEQAADTSGPIAADLRPLLILYNIQKRANFGDLLRTAAAFGVCEVVVVGMKKISTMGAHGADKSMRYDIFVFELSTRGGARRASAGLWASRSRPLQACPPHRRCR